MEQETIAKINKTIRILTFVAGIALAIIMGLAVKKILLNG
jgi:hypothetical protein